MPEIQRPRCHYAPTGVEVFCPDPSSEEYLERCISDGLGARKAVDISPDQVDELGRRGFTTLIREAQVVEWSEGRRHYGSTEKEARLIGCKAVQALYPQFFENNEEQ